MNRQRSPIAESRYQCLANLSLRDRKQPECRNRARAAFQRFREPLTLQSVRAQSPCSASISTLPPG